MQTSDLAAGPAYHVRVFRTGTCRVKGRYAYFTYAKDRDHRYDLYIGAITGNGLTALVDTGMESVAEMNRGAGFLMSELITQGPGEDTASILDEAGIEPAKVAYVFLTHCHYDHCSNLSMFPSAQVVVPAYAWDLWHTHPERAAYLHEGFLAYLEMLHGEGRLLFLDEGLVTGGLGVRRVGGHSPCSQFVYVNTSKGVVAFTGDTVQMYMNLEMNDIVHIHEDEDECWRALEVARTTADFVLPGHDPQVLERYPGGIVA
jgi:glyoxylase-like metal-dependent hydrolase (beta-lactamase superfamily II)